MADRQTLITALRNAHNAGDTAAATRIAGMIKAMPVEAPTSPQEAPQGATPTQAPTPEQQATQSDSGGFMQGVTDTLKASGRIAAGVLPAVANVGVGVVNAGLSAADWAAEQAGGNIDYRLPAAGYGDSEFAKEYLTPQTTGEKIVSSLPSYVMGGELVAPVKAAANAGRVTRFATSALNNLPSAITGELSEHNQGDLSAGDIAVNTVLPAAVERVGGSLVKGVRNVLPESFGGYSTAQKTAEVVAPEAVERVLQGGNVEAQQAFRTATTNASGESTLLPSQVFNTEAGNKYIAAESRDMLRGDKSIYNPRLAEQQSGEGLERAVAGADTGKPLQESAQDITGQFKQQSSKLYNESKSNAQQILDDKNVTEMHFRNTKDLASQHLEADAQAGKINLNAETRRTLNQLQNTKFDSIDVLDNWKRALSEKASKAYKAGDYNSSNTLREVLNNLRGEADATIQSIDPAAGSIYRDADKYFSESVGDFGSGKKSVLGKVAANESESAANKMLVGGGQRSSENAVSASEAMQNALATGSLDDAANLSLDFSGALGSATRSEALRVGSTGANFSPTKFANRLNQLQPQAQAATDLAAMVGGKDEAAVNSALADAVGITRQKAKGVGRVTNALASGTGRVVGSGIGAALGSTLGGVGAAIGAAAGERASKVIGEGLVDRLMGLPARGDKYIQFLSDPANAKAVSDILANQGGLNAPVEAVTRAVDALTQSSYSNLNTNTVEPSVASVAPAIEPIQAEPEQHAQVARKPVTTNTDNFDPKVTKLYKALAHAETGGLNNRFIRTKAAESGVSTAYGAAQLTVSTMQDFYKRHSSMFDAKERDYISRFIDQGNIMKHAPSNDPVFGYGGTGVLGGKEDRKLYARVVRKMLAQMIKENGGSLDKTVMQWRGNPNDHAYFAKVRNAFKSS